MDSNTPIRLKPYKLPPIGSITKKMLDESQPEHLKQQDKATVQDYEEALRDVDRLVRELDVIWNGEDGAAKQASLCDVVGQIRKELPKLRSNLNRCKGNMEYFVARVEAGTIHSRMTYRKFKDTLEELKK